jgi:hypothetical protein
MVGMTLPGFRRQVPSRSYVDTDGTQVTRVAFIRSLSIRVTPVTGRSEKGPVGKAGDRTGWFGNDGQRHGACCDR